MGMGIKIWQALIPAFPRFKPKYRTRISTPISGIAFPIPDMPRRYFWRLALAITADESGGGTRGRARRRPSRLQSVVYTGIFFCTEGANGPMARNGCMGKLIGNYGAQQWGERMCAFTAVNIWEYPAEKSRVHPASSQPTSRGAASQGTASVWPAATEVRG